MTVTPLPLTLPELVIDCLGEPVPQGSKSVRVVKGRAYLYEDNPALLGKDGWRAKIVTAASARARLAGWAPLDCAVEVVITFWMTRPKSVPVTAREYPCVKPDSDKLTRAVFDALTIAEIVTDDARIVHHDVWQRYAVATPGVRITVRPLP
jgi:Holliday junction resolvase RusA-like endonuclease